MDRADTPAGGYLVAEPEKALADKLLFTGGPLPATVQGFVEYLEDDLRIDPEGLGRLQPERLQMIATAAGSRRLRLLAAAVRSILGPSGS
jgi:hypothetical protein